MADMEYMDGREDLPILQGRGFGFKSIHNGLRIDKRYDEWNVAIFMAGYIPL